MNLELVFRHPCLYTPEHALRQTVSRGVRALRHVPGYILYPGMHRCSMAHPVASLGDGWGWGSHLIPATCAKAQAPEFR